MEKIQSYCGIECNKCEYMKTTGCKGCTAYSGHMQWGECEIAKCVNSKYIRFCGECADFPCDKLKKFSYDKEHGDNGERIENCKKWKADLVKEAGM